MRTLVIACLSLAAAYALGQAASEKQVVGSWKFDTKTLKIEWSAEAKAYANDPKSGTQAKGAMAKVKTDLAKLYGTLTWTFKPNHTFVIAGKTPKDKQTGTWLLYGRKVTVVLTDASHPVPAIEIDKSGKSMHTTFKESGMGTATVDLVKG